ncbi:hypothetical protein PILCRDRAFT_12062 [Piloderma croceum F 1598]|uniref:Uncharacterized protein n=1 Tax=Piloderma croceum (strain F 1598) TaxID=765440 RepID=A0A0C3FC31_PILCF|nr:hypothetical protein PILCRDRAFT_12062 [Piloderma croceum F 1598]
MGARQLLKDVLRRFRILYALITLTRYTTCYFFLALVSCLVQITLQAGTFSVNAQGVQMMSTILAEAKVREGFPIIRDSTLQICDSIPGQDGTLCNVVSGQSQHNLTFDAQATSSPGQRRALTGEAQFDPSGNLQGVIISNGASPPQSLSEQCVVSLSWLNDLLRDARTGDAVTLAFQIWLLGLSLVTILNESIPHLFAVLVSHVLDTVWAGLRVSSTSQTRKLYETLVVNDACNGVDINTALWDARMSNAIAIVAVNYAVFLGVLCISLKLFDVYKSQMVKYVGTSTRANILVLAFSASLQLAGFFILASTALWIDKLSYGAIRRATNHLTLYQVGFIVTAILEIPWLGWISVRREKHSWFAAFLFLGLILVIISSALFASVLYRFIFQTWPFFAAVFAYILLVLTTILDVSCRLKFRNGFTDYLTIDEKKTEKATFAPFHIANRLAKPLPKEPAPTFSGTDVEKVSFQAITAPAPAVVREDSGSTPRHIKSMLRRLSGKPRRLGVTFVDAVPSTAAERPLPESPAETPDDIVLSYGSMSPGRSAHSYRPTSRTDTSRFTLSTAPPPRRFQARITSRWSMSTAGDDMAYHHLPTANFSAAHHAAKNVITGLPSNASHRN